MRRNRRDSLRKERIIMVASSAFVLAALTMTGLYMKGQEIKKQDDGYTLDFTALENSADQKFQEIQDREQAKTQPKITQPIGTGTNMENDLDYMPAEEAGSGMVEIPGLTDNIVEEKPVVREKPEILKEEPEIAEEIADMDSAVQEEPVYIEPQVERTLHFSQEDRLIRPVSGDVILPYSMNGSIYFQTLAQYKYNPATVYSAEEGAVVAVCAEGKIVRIFQDAEIGSAVTVDLGDGYLATYGQLSDIQVRENDYVDAGTVLASVAKPTKYFSLEGPNLYFRLEKDGIPMDPEDLY